MLITKRQWEQICVELEGHIGLDARRAWFDAVWPLPAISKPKLLWLGTSNASAVEHIRTNYTEAIEKAAEAVLDLVPTIELVHADRRPAAVPDISEKNATPPVVPQAHQGEFFIPDIAEIAIKEDVHLMRVAPFTLQPRGETRTELVYENVNGTNIRITADPNYGLTHPEDHIIFLMMKSWLMEQANHYQRELRRHEDYAKQGKQYPKPSSPPRYYCPSATDILKFRGDHGRAGSEDRKSIPDRLDRLQTCKVRISKAVGRTHRRYGTFSFIQDWSILAHTRTGTVSQVRIDIPNWIYEGIVEAERPTVLTYDPAYRDEKRPLMQFLYRYCRSLDCDIPNFGDEIGIPTVELHRNSASRKPLKKFNAGLSTDIKNLPDGRFYNWHLSVDGLRQQRQLKVRQLRGVS